ncbi:hypothetical protein MH215_10415 [Paenibacillus sp. ACRSA]|uniref:hypothetical protein n=1 Tax=Paenibacillus sp. ACRSA TaxID=2918211 RepID=UPI001EF6E90F|nr:hypothetical protein [Paenibacillus sp. ACRSA]MCG7377409.1 hypothetical protein [Paenibacillus sp. ACRSA]
MGWVFDWIETMWKNNVIGSVIMPLIAVLIGWWLANMRADKKEKKDEQNQRIKLLHMLSHELETVIRHYNEKKKYYTKESLTGKLIVNSPLFNVDNHKDMLSGLWEYLRGYESLNTAIDTIPMQFAPKQLALLDESRYASNNYNLEKYKELSDEFVNKEIASIIDESVQYIITAARPLLEEVEKQIKIMESK